MPKFLMDMLCMVRVIVQQIVTVQKMEHVHVLVKPDHVCADQTVHAVLMEPANAQKDVHVIKAEHAFALVKPDHVCADQTVIVVINLTLIR
jgi:hypothetical protein